MRNGFRILLTVIFLMTLTPSLHAAKYNAYGLDFFTAETDHFRIHYHKGLEHLITRVGNQCEKLYSIYRNTYGLTLPSKTDFVVIDGDISNGWAFANTNTITIWTHDFDFNLRGSHDWFEDVITHEYAHIVSIQTGLKLPSPIPEVRIGYFSHPNEKARKEIFQSIASDILPHWFTEGIAQYSSSIHGTDTWDSHRDMILRSLVLSGKVLSWDNMQVFSGKGDSFEKTYNHGFSMVKYIVETYGEDKLVALLRESNKVLRMDFDGSMKAVLGISARAFYNEWKQHLYAHYKAQLDSIGKQVYGKKINKDGYENFWPSFSSDDSKVYFLSNGKNDYGFKRLYTVNLSDTVKEKERIKPVAGVRSFYDMHPKSGRLCFVSPHSKKSMLPARLGGVVSSDLFTDTIPPEKPSFTLFPKKTEKQVTIQKGIFSAAFSPDGNRLACAKRSVDRFYLAITDTSGNKFSLVYPPKKESGLAIDFIYSVDWSPDGKSIAFSYFDRHDRNIAVYDTAAKTCSIVCRTASDERDPSFSPDGRYLYFSSDRSGIFNLYRYEFATKHLQQITNVTGGAFAPSVNSKDNKLVYAGYDASGYSIYLLDSIAPLSDTLLAEGMVDRTSLDAPSYTVSIRQSQPYSYLPKQYLIVPTVLVEQTVSESENVNKGVSALKIGAIFNLLEPLTLSNLGNELGGYFFLQPEHLFSISNNFINPHHRGINISSNYDFGVFGSTRLFPLTLSGEYLQRGIAGVDWFFNETEGEMSKLPYRLDLQNANLQMSHFIDGEYENGSVPRNQLAVHLITGMNSYNVNLLLEDWDVVFQYNLSKGYRIGTMGTYSSTRINPDRSISPQGLIAKLQYDFWNQYSLNEENSFDPSGKERYNQFLFHQVTGHTKIGMETPWAARHTLHADLQGRYLQVLKQDTLFPSYYLPGAWVPGYSYYHRKMIYRDTLRVHDPKNPADTLRVDSLLIDTLTLTGRAVISGELSYRFPVSPKFIDRKFWFFYLERMFGAVNVNFGGAWDNPVDFFKFKRNDYLLAYGLEARLEAITFNSYPFAMKFRWDYGADRVKTVGGNKFTFSIGYDFDNWGMVLSPDFEKSSLRIKGL